MKRHPFSISSLLLASGLVVSHGTARAQTAPVPPARVIYGPAVSSDAARRAMAAAVAEATRNGWTMSIAIVDPAGQLIQFEKMDESGGGTVQVAIDKAKSAALFRRSTKAFADSLASGNTFLLALPGAMPLEGGLPLLIDGKVVGAIGVSGGTGVQDGIVAKAGVDIAVSPAR